MNHEEHEDLLLKKKAILRGLRVLRG